MTTADENGETNTILYNTGVIPGNKIIESVKESLTDNSSDKGMFSGLKVVINLVGSLAKEASEKAMDHQLEVESIRSDYGFNCGPIALAAVLNYYGEDLDPNDPNGPIFDNDGTSHVQLAQWAKNFGYDSYIGDDGTVSTLTSYIDQGVPVIANVHAGLEKKGKQIDHYVVVSGYDMDDNGDVSTISYCDYWVDDATYSMSVDDFMDFWASAKTDNSYIAIFNRPPPDTPTYSWSSDGWGP
jgi:hypothetical protein